MLSGSLPLKHGVSSLCKWTRCPAQKWMMAADEVETRLHKVNGFEGRQDKRKWLIIQTTNENTSVYINSKNKLGRYCIKICIKYEYSATEL
jgi:hypothetical protein